MWRILLAPILIALSASVAAACTCFSEPHGKTFRQSEAIFVGKLVSIGVEEIRKEGVPPLHSLTFDVEKKWKDIKSRRVIVFTNNPGPCSAFEFREGERYLLYVRKIKGVLFVTSDCASSVELNSDSAQDRVKNLNSFWFRLKARLWRF